MNDSAMFSEFTSEGIADELEPMDAHGFPLEQTAPSISQLPGAFEDLFSDALAQSAEGTLQPADTNDFLFKQTGSSFNHFPESFEDFFPDALAQSAEGTLQPADAQNSPLEQSAFSSNHISDAQAQSAEGASRNEDAHEVSVQQTALALDDFSNSPVQSAKDGFQATMQETQDATHGLLFGNACINPAVFDMSHMTPEAMATMQSTINDFHADKQASTNFRRAPVRSNKTKKRQARTIFSKDAKHWFKQVYDMRPIPTPDDVSYLSAKTGHAPKNIKKWFSNAGRGGKKRDDLHFGLYEQNLATQTRRLSSGSRSSLERWISRPAEEEAVPMSVIEAAVIAESHRMPKLNQSSLQEDSDSTDWATVADSRSDVSSATPFLSTNSEITERDGRAPSAVGSHHSFSSSSSCASGRSMLSLGFRDPRKGMPRYKTTASRTRSEKSKGLYFCTWPTCNQTFKRPYDWRRHEEATHYQPYRWECCRSGVDGGVDPTIASRHVSQCHQDHGSRIFYRNDQLMAHLRSAKPPPLSNEEILRSVPLWKEDNPNFQSASLRCGFCSQSLTSWEARHDHVIKHINEEELRYPQWQKYHLCLCESQVVEVAGHRCPKCHVYHTRTTTRPRLRSEASWQKLEEALAQRT